MMILTQSLLMWTVLKRNVNAISFEFDAWNYWQALQLVSRHISNKPPIHESTVLNKNWYMELLWNGMSGFPWVSYRMQNYSVASTLSHSIKYQSLQYSRTDESINRSKISNMIDNYFPPDVAMFAKTFCTSHCKHNHQNH